jgi:hypothetical protein
MRCNIRQLVAIGATVALTLAVAIPIGSMAVGQPAADDVPSNGGNSFFRRVFPDADGGRPSKGRAALLHVAADEAYLASVADLKAGKLTDPEMVYRWSLRLMKAAEGMEDSPVPAAKRHLQRMIELADLVKKQETNLHNFAANYYRAEAESMLADATAKAGEGASASHDAAIEVAENYVKAVVKGNSEAATKLASPGSLAASKRLMESFKDFANAETLRIISVQNVGRDNTSVHLEEVQTAGQKSNGQARGHFTIDLERKDGRWLVARFTANKADRRQKGAPSWPAAGAAKTELESPSRALDKPKVTKVVRLKHAHAQALRNTLGELLKDRADLKLGFDEDTNTLLVRGINETVEEIEALIIELDSPAARPAAGSNPREQATQRVPGPNE